MKIDKDIFTRKEDLCEELLLYRTQNRKVGGYFIQHPLVFSVPHSDQMNALCNEQLKQKKIVAKQYLEVYDYAGYVFLHERPYRLHAFVEVCKNLSDKEYWEMLAEVWADSENIWQNKAHWKNLLSDRQDTKHLFMCEEDKAAFDALPEELIIYRGYTEGKNKRGFSYTLSKEKAEWFSKRYWNKNPALLKRKVKKSDVFAYTNGRNEQEIIILIFDPLTL